MTPYPKYKPTGIEWIGEIPSHWNFRRMKYEVDYEKGKNPKEQTFDEKGKPYLSMEYLRGNPSQIFYVEDFKNYLNVKAHEILILWDGSNAGEFIRSREGVLSSTMAVLNIHSNNSDYAWYFFKTFERNLKQATIGMGIPHVNGEELKNQIFIIPTKEEQTAIADYLDKKTAQIDTLIANKQKLIDRLKEERTAIINEAVSGKGKKWEKKKLKYVAKLKSGDGITADDIRPDGEYLVYGGNGLRGYTSAYTHDGDYILIGRQGALCGNINYAKGKFFASEHAVVVSILDSNEFIWLGELLGSMNLNQYSQASAQPGLSVEKISNLAISVPPIKEQTAIVQHIQTETQKIDNTISKIEKEIELMQEYRTALISEVVTGKIDVRSLG